MSKHKTLLGTVYDRFYGKFIISEDRYEVIVEKSYTDTVFQNKMKLLW